MNAEIFVPAAASRLVKQAEVDQMIVGGLEVIACGAKMSDEAIFTDASQIIEKALKAVYVNLSARTGLSKTAFEIALKQLI